MITLSRPIHPSDVYIVTYTNLDLGFINLFIFWIFPKIDCRALIKFELTTTKIIPMFENLLLTFQNVSVANINMSINNYIFIIICSLSNPFVTQHSH